MTTRHSLSRRRFVKLASGCAAHLALMATPFPAASRDLWTRRTQGRVAAQESFGRLESLDQGLWAFVSTPLSGDYTTVCNGGIVAGSEGVLVVEAFQTQEGARWMAEKARELTGRWPTHVLVTHFHGDHTGGARGFLPDHPSEAHAVTPPDGGVVELHVTATTLDLKKEGSRPDADETALRPWADAILVAEDAPTSLSLGDRSVRIHPRDGHTPSDLTLELQEEGITWCGDLVWNGMFPNYMDAVPSRLSRAVRALRRSGARIYVPGHGPLAEPGDLERYVSVIDGIEETARRGLQEGWTPQEAAERHRIPEDLGEWTLFNPTYFQRAIEAWFREWS